MFNIYEKINELLNTLGYPVYFENFVDESATIPCISFYIVSDINSHLGDDISYDDITVRVTVWTYKGNTEAFPIAKQIESLLNANGFKRNGTNDLFLEDNLMKKVLSYRCVAKENI